MARPQVRLKMSESKLFSLLPPRTPAMGWRVSPQLDLRGWSKCRIVFICRQRCWWIS